MKLSTTIILGAAVVGAGVFLYRRGRMQADQTISQPSLPKTLVAGVRSLVTEFTAGAPAPGGGAPAPGTPTTASGDAALSATVPRHSTFRLTRLQSAYSGQTKADLFAQGIN